MSGWLDQTKYGIQQHLSKLYKDAKAKAPPEEFKEFELWFWKIRSLLTVDWTIYNRPSTSETEGPNLPISPTINKSEMQIENSKNDCDKPIEKIDNGGDQVSTDGMSNQDSE